MKSEAETERQRLEALASLKTERGDIGTENLALNSNGFGVALHTSYICLDNASRFLLENQTILSHPDLYRLADQAHELLFELYQAIGKKLAMSK